MTYLEMRGNTRHNSKKLDALLGRTVTVTLTDGTTVTGKLSKAKYGFRYALEISPQYGSILFAKTLVKNIKEVIT